MQGVDGILDEVTLLNPIRLSMFSWSVEPISKQYN